MREKYEVHQFGTNFKAPNHVQDEFDVLMSLALDGLLDPDEEVRFESHLNSYPTLAQTWRQWQIVDSQFAGAPSVATPLGFLQRFDARLMQQERRKHLWWGVAFGSFALLLTGAILLSVAALGVFVALNRADWLTQLVHTMAYAYVAVNSWMATLMAALEAVAASQQARTFGVTYALAALALVSWWIGFLRRTTVAVRA